MKYWFCIIIIIIGFSNCAFSDLNGSFANSSIQSVDMGKLPDIKIIEIASLNYPDIAEEKNYHPAFNDIDKEHLNDSLIQSLKRSDVRVLPSAQTKIHIDFTQLFLSDGGTGRIMTMTADVAVSRNGIITRKTLEINSETKRTLGATKDNALKKFILELAELLREQSSFKR